MINTNLLRGKVVANGLTLGECAERIGMSRSTFFRKMQAGVFESTEIEALATALNITDHSEFLSIFFTIFDS